nr:hypothetical protein Cbor_448 [Cedratvirus borely]
MDFVYGVIFSFSEGYNFLNGQVCREFRILAPQVSYVVYLDQLIRDGKQPENFPPSEFGPSRKLAKIAIEKGLLALLGQCTRHVRSDLCKIAAKKGNLKVLQWARSEGWFYRLAIKFFTKHSFVKNLLG